MSFQYLKRMDWVISVGLRLPIDLQSHYLELISQIFLQEVITEFMLELN